MFSNVNFTITLNYIKFYQIDVDLLRLHLNVKNIMLDNNFLRVVHIFLLKQKKYIYIR